MEVLLGLIGLIIFVLGPIGFFLSVGVRPRLLELERARASANPALFDRITSLEQRLRRIEEYLAGQTGLPVPAAPAPEPEPEPEKPAEALLADIAAAVAAAAAAPTTRPAPAEAAP